MTMSKRDGRTQSIWRRSVDTAAYVANERVRFHPVMVIILIAIAWGVVAAMEGIDASLKFLPWAVALAYPILAMMWVLVFLAVLLLSLALIPFGDAVENHLARSSRRRRERREERRFRP